MRKRLYSSARAAAIMVATLAGCADPSDTGSQLASDWQGPAAADGSRSYAIDWACEPKRFGRSAETRADQQEEYCEWRSIAVSATEQICQFTTSFDHSRDFYLDSRGQTPINSIGAAQQLRDDCSRVAMRRLQQGASVGHNCSEVDQGGGGCVAERNSDPEICDKVRLMVGQKFHGALAFTIDAMPPDGVDDSPLPLMRFGLLNALPRGCDYSQADHTEVKCRVPASSRCFALSGQLRVGLRVLTTSAKAPGVVASAPSSPPQVKSWHHHAVR